MKHEKTPNKVIIDVEEYEDLLQDQRWLNCLQDAGVDNWSGYDFACELYEEYYGDHED